MPFVLLEQKRQQPFDVLVLDQSRAPGCFLALLQKEAAVANEEDDAESTAPLESSWGIFLRM